MSEGEFEAGQKLMVEARKMAVSEGLWSHKTMAIAVAGAGMEASSLGDCTIIQELMVRAEGEEKWRDYCPDSFEEYIKKTFEEQFVEEYKSIGGETK
jgi:hypothetical protein